MTTRSRVKPDILPILEEALAQGFRVFIPNAPGVRRTPAGFAYVCLDTDGSFALVNGGQTSFDPVRLSAPITPDRTYGSSVLIDYDGTVDGAVRTLQRICKSDVVVVRFMGNDPAPVVPNYGRKGLDKFPGGIRSFVELQPIHRPATRRVAEHQLPHTVAA
ncbi:hypothetical protein [Arthrobacter sp. ES1]|uniref:hypothetical protein n=1 Tax=Arthrobacter sp. ES1 TaxID=1897056 RepID=UPI001CFFA976|nr:hypothetical protein [Arthrobacter sp. ES1]MCB5280486.1 hypothetical protein [Arthrobacter sp. ES1]